MPNSGYTRIDLVCVRFCAALFAAGWAVASAAYRAFEPLSRLITWAWQTAFPYPLAEPEPRLATAAVIDLGQVRARAFERRRLERLGDREMATGCGLRIAA